MPMPDVTALEHLTCALCDWRELCFARVREVKFPAPLFTVKTAELGLADRPQVHFELHRERTVLAYGMVEGAS